MEPRIDTSSLYRSQDAYSAAQRFYDAQIQRLTAPFETIHVETRHGRTHVLTAGDRSADVLVLWHGMNANLTSWIDYVNMFADRYFVVVPDAPGNSGRSEPRRMDRRTVAYGEWAADVLTRLDVSSADHVGISGGGWLIIKLSTIAPTLVRRAVLISSAGFLPVNPSLIFKVLPYMLFGSPEQAARRFLKVMSPPNHVVSELDVEVFSHLFGFRSERSVPVVADAEIARLTAPTMLLMGEHEVTYNPHKVIERARRLIPNLVSARIVEDVGHGMTSEKPREVYQQIMDFLESASSQ